MKNTILVGLACMGLLGALAACGDDEGGSGGSAGASSSAASSSSAGGGGAGGGSGGGGGAGGGAPTINGCIEGAAEDHTADATVKITFGMGGFVYAPACIRVKKGTAVTFEGMFSLHPLVGGTTGAPPVPDGASPIKPTNSGTAATFTLDTAGTFPYYCENHQPSMAGAIFVE